MAVRDKSQNVGFIYTNIYQLYKKAQNAEAGAVANAGASSEAAALKSDSRVWRAEELQGVKITKFEPRQFATTKPLITPADVAPAPKAAPVNPFDDLKSNLNRLQDLHSQLRFMLKELEDLVNKK